MSAPGGRPGYDPTRRRPLGWCRVPGVPSESTFSRAFAWFAETRLPGRMHGAPVSAAHGGPVVGHISRDSTATGGRERPAIPLSRMTAERGDHRHGLMDAAHHSREIGLHALLAGRVPVTGTDPRRDAGPHPPRPRAPQAALQRRAGELRPEGLMRRTARPRPRAREDGPPPVLWRAGPDGPPADAARRPALRLRQRRKPPTPPHRTRRLATAAGTANNCARGSKYDN